MRLFNWKKQTNILRLLGSKINLVLRLALLGWLFYILYFIWQNLFPVLIKPEDVTADAVIQQDRAINQQIKAEVFSRIEEKTTIDSSTAWDIPNPF